MISLHHMKHLLYVIIINLIIGLNADAIAPTFASPLSGTSITHASSKSTKGKKKKRKRKSTGKRTTTKRKASRMSKYYEIGYEDGYDDGYNDGIDCCAYEDDFFPQTTLRGKARQQYLEGYTDGYDDGFIDGQADR